MAVAFQFVLLFLISHSIFPPAFWLSFWKDCWGVYPLNSFLSRRLFSANKINRKTMEASGCCNINISTGLEQSFFIKAFICLKNLSVAVMLNICWMSSRAQPEITEKKIKLQAFGTQWLSLWPHLDHYKLSLKHKIDDENV